MSSIVFKYKVSLSGPKDIQSLHNIFNSSVRKLSDEFYSDKGDIILETAYWDTDVYPSLSNLPQGVINKQMIGSSDILVATFRTRIGSPTPDDISGTVEEINYFIRNKRPVLLYFSEEKFELSNLDEEQFRRLKEFKNDVGKRGLYKAFTSESDFEFRLANDLKKLIKDIHKSTFKDNFKHFHPTNVDNEFVSALAKDRASKIGATIDKIIRGHWELKTLPSYRYAAHMFGKFIDILDDGDEYLTLTNIEFWSDETMEPEHFLQTNLNAANRGVNIKRIFIVSKNENITYKKDLIKILEPHTRTRKDLTNPNKMLVKVYETESLSKSMHDYGHFGLGRRLKKEKTEHLFSIEPSYEHDHFKGPSSRSMKVLNINFNGESNPSSACDRLMKNFKICDNSSVPIADYLESLQTFINLG